VELPENAAKFSEKRKAPLFPLKKEEKERSGGTEREGQTFPF